MKVVTIRELHEKTGELVRQAARYGEIQVTHQGRTVAKILPEKEPEQTPYFSRRKVSASYRKLAQSGRLSLGADSTMGISEEREER